MNDAKPWWQSRTLWVNVLTLIALGADKVLNLGVIPPGYEQLVVLGLAGVNLVLRFLTDKPVQQSLFPVAAKATPASLDPLAAFGMLRKVRARLKARGQETAPVEQLAASLLEEDEQTAA